MNRTEPGSDTLDPRREGTNSESKGWDGLPPKILHRDTEKVETRRVGTLTPRLPKTRYRDTGALRGQGEGGLWNDPERAGERVGVRLSTA